MKRQRRTDMEINQRAPLVARQEIFIQAQPQAVWKIHADINSWSRWQPGIASSKLDGPLTAGAVFQWKPGGITINSTIEVVEPNERIDWTGTAIGTQARHIRTFKPHQDGTLLTTEKSMEGWLTRALKVMTPRFLEESLDTWLQSLKKQAESG
jgi:polyketide cyclase/dehydrase/lipid transport protein